MKVCKKCLLTEKYPLILFDEKGICNFCRQEQRITNESMGYDELVKCLSRLKEKNIERGKKYDVLVPMSGGVDSCNTLIDLVEEYHLTPLAYHCDHGYEDSIATQNVRELCKVLDVDLVIYQQDICFMKKLWKCVNESKIPLSGCYICGNILYVNALEVAKKFNINFVVNGYSKGQVYIVHDKEKGYEALEMLNKVIENTNDKKFIEQFYDKYDILQYHIPFESKKDFEILNSLEKILVLPFFLFRFNRLDKEMLRKRVMSKFNWVPLGESYPRRTTNCKMVWLNSYMDLQKMGYTCYHEEYSVLIRKDEISRDQAEKDLFFSPPDGLLEELANDIGINIYNGKK